jgi:hypothetical protein
MATFSPDNASIDCSVAALALAAGDVPLARHLLSRAALMLRIRAAEPRVMAAVSRTANDC